MTFTEAAVEVLRLVGRPLHYKKITEIAIERNLLSHVGKSPEITMSSRLATMVKKDRGEAPIVKVKPGVFGLRDFSEEVMRLADLEPESEDLPDVVIEDEETEEKAEAPAAPAPKPDHKLPGSEVFPEEADDDLPILGKLDDPEGEGDDDARRKRRKKRRGRGEGEGEGARQSGQDRPRDQGRERDRDRSREHGRERDRGGRDQPRDRDRDRDRNRDQPRDFGRDRHARPEPITGDWHREPDARDSSGKDLADAIEAALEARGRRPQTLVSVADDLVRRGRLAGDAASLAPTLAATMRGDNARRTGARQRARFRMAFGEVVLTDWDVPVEVSRAEADIARAASRHRDMVHRAFIRRVSELPTASLLELVATWLSAAGVAAIRGVRRPTSHPGEFHLAGVVRRGPEETPVAIVVMREGQITRERVVDVRGSLHHYGDARSAWMITLGQVLSGAREEAASSGAAPVALFDGMQLARAMEDAGVGLVRHHVPLVALDAELLDALRGPGARREPRPEPAPVHRPAPAAEERAPKETSGEDVVENGEAAAENGEGRRKRRRRRRRRGRDQEEGGAAEGAAEGGLDGEEEDADTDADDLEQEVAPEREIDEDLDTTGLDDDEDAPTLDADLDDEEEPLDGDLDDGYADDEDEDLDVIREDDDELDPAPLDDETSDEDEDLDRDDEEDDDR